MRSDMQTSDEPPSDIVSGKRVKPAMGVLTDTQSPPSGGSLPGAPPRGPRVPTAPDHRRLATKFDLRISPDLRERLRVAAAKEGVADGVFIRRLLADAVGAEAPADREGGPRVRIPPEEQAVLAGALRDLGALYEPLSRATVPVAEVKAGLDKVRAAIMPVVIGLAGRCA